MKQESGSHPTAELLTEALEFFNLSLSELNRETFHKRFHELALKYHPDSGEYSTTEVFNRLVVYRDVLKEYLADTVAGLTAPKTDDDFTLYKKAKKKENDAVNDYFNETGGNRIFLEAKDNPALRTLRTRLKEAIELYDKVIDEFPESIWRADIKKSKDKLYKTWMK